MPDNLNLTSAQAVYVATRMEQRAVALYERALMVFAPGEEMKAVLSSLLREEQAHLDSFLRLQLLEGEVTEEDKLLLDGEAQSVLFSGGLAGAVREGAFDSPLSLLHYAADEEERAVARYHAYANNAHGNTRETFLLIARQEQRHLDRINTQIARLQEEADA